MSCSDSHHRFLAQLITDLKKRGVLDNTILTQAVTPIQRETGDGAHVGRLTPDEIQAQVKDSLSRAAIFLDWLYR